MFCRETEWGGGGGGKKRIAGYKECVWGGTGWTGGRETGRNRKDKRQDKEERMRLHNSWNILWATSQTSCAWKYWLFSTLDLKRLWVTCPNLVISSHPYLDDTFSRWGRTRFYIHGIQAVIQVGVEAVGMVHFSVATFTNQAMQLIRIQTWIIGRQPRLVYVCFKFDHLCIQSSITERLPRYEHITLPHFVC